MAAPGLGLVAGPVHGILAPLHLALPRHLVRALALVPEKAVLWIGKEECISRILLIQI